MAPSLALATIFACAFIFAIHGVIADPPFCISHRDGASLAYPTSLTIPFPNPSGQGVDDEWQSDDGYFRARTYRHVCNTEKNQIGVYILLDADSKAHSGSTKGPGNVWRVQIKPGENGASGYYYFNLQHGKSCYVCFDYADEMKATAVDVSRDM